MNLRPEDAALLIAQTRSEKTVLIGGQAVAFWIRQFRIRPRLAALTVDIDFLGTKAEAKRNWGATIIQRQRQPSAGAASMTP